MKKQRWMFQRAAFSRSASGSTMLADLPPSSRQTRLTVSAAAAPTCAPAAVDPVNEIMSTPGWRDSASPTSRPVPFTRLNTPGGSSASCSTWAINVPLAAEFRLGLATIVHPAARA